jgi:hypothetical protein
MSDLALDQIYYQPCTFCFVTVVMRAGIRLPFLRIPLEDLPLLNQQQQVVHHVLLARAAALLDVLQRLDQNENSHLLSSFCCCERTVLRNS